MNIGDSLGGLWQIPEALAEILRKCWQPEPSNRPTSSAILATLEALLRPPSASPRGDRKFISISKILPGILSTKTFHPKSKIFSNSRSVSVVPFPTDEVSSETNLQSPEELHQSQKKNLQTFDLSKKIIQPSQRPPSRYVKGRSPSELRLYQMR